VWTIVDRGKTRERSSAKLWRRIRSNRKSDVSHPATVRGARGQTRDHGAL